MYNIAHNLGNIYDLTEEMVYRFIDWETQIEKVFFWHRYGFAMGSIVSDVLKGPEDFDPYNGNTSYEREQLFDEE